MFVEADGPAGVAPVPCAACFWLPNLGGCPPVTLAGPALGGGARAFSGAGAAGDGFGVAGTGRAAAGGAGFGGGALAIVRPYL